MEELDLLLCDSAGTQVWRGQWPAHVRERLIADAHMTAVLAGTLPNDGAPIRFDGLTVDGEGGHVRLRVEVGAGSASFKKTWGTEALRDDAEVVLARLVATNVLATGTYRFSSALRQAAMDAGGRLRFRPMPRCLGKLPERSIFDTGVTALPLCHHPLILMPRPQAERLVAHARTTSDEVASLIVSQPFVVQESASCRLAIYIVEVVPLGNGTTGTADHVRITPEALAEVRVDDARGMYRGGLAHSHPFGEKMAPHFLSTEDKAVACGFFWLPYHVQFVVDPRFREPEDALAAFCWVDAVLTRVCFKLIET